MEAKIPIKLRSYRAFKHPWTGSPSTPPIIHTEAIKLENGVITVIHVSWNGDTRTVKWEFNEIDGKGNAKKLGSTERQGFETRFEYKTFVNRVFAEAFDVSGRSLGKSEVATTRKLSPLNEGSSAEIDIPESEQEHEPSPQDGHGGSASASGPSGFWKSSNTFVIGLVCGAVVTASAWICMQVYKKYGDRILRKEQDAKYMPLQQDNDQ